MSKYANIGLTPDLGVSTLLPAAIGQRRALQLLLQDRTIDAATALDWGLVAEVVAPARASRLAPKQIARFWLENATAAFGQAKRLVRVGADRAFDDNLADEAATIGARFDTEESKLRVAAFAAASRKSPPRLPHDADPTHRMARRNRGCSPNDHVIGRDNVLIRRVRTNSTQERQT